METAKKPEIKSKVATVKVPKEGELIRKLHDNLPELTKEINENRKKAKLSAHYMRNYYFLKNYKPKKG